MKRKVAMFTCLLVAVSVCSADVVTIGDFEGTMDPWWAGWSTSVGAVEENSTVGDWSLEGYVENGGWIGIAEVALLDRTDGAALKNALATIGQITLDATSFYNSDDTYNWHQIGIAINCDGYWDGAAYVNMEASGVAGSYTLQLSEAAMTAIAAAETYVNIIILSCSNETVTETDGITGEVSVIFDGAITTYFDNVQVVVPEPATVAMLGVGILSLIRRKR